MTELSESDLHKLFKDDRNIPFNKNTNKKERDALSLFIIILLITLIVITWLSVYFYYLSYVNSSKKYNGILSRLSLNLKGDTLRYNKVKTNLIFFKQVNKNQVNISNLLYLLSIHRFGLTYVQSITVRDGHIYIGMMSSGRRFLKGLRLMRDYAVYLNIYSLQMHTGSFKITSLIETKTKSNKGVLGVLTSGRY
ncbi:MAG: hypothetical protein EVJ47_08600 [Candidatus Acidulodesulfobacterium ferriphilum]|jgi:hypothetical protein|uniref:Uncharacterized protein n=1 Tax=Candidatus Acidulodesulfobacterium ferriphilum TaxID=2597223 RepID=A0A519B9U5_9DELT|nr:MAG: hypothetical protein EVJ47_08600 [Candidatus Acidulodesulfobacterium ferriphilum]